MTAANLYQPGWTPDQFDVESLARRKNAHYLVSAKRDLRAYPFANEGVRWLKEKGIRTAIVSNSKRSELHQTLHHLGLLGNIWTKLSREMTSLSLNPIQPLIFLPRALSRY